MAEVDRTVRRARPGAARRVGGGARRGRKVAAALEEAGLDVLYDERDERPGEKFADADLIGCPVRVIVGKRTLEDGSVDLRTRDGVTDERVSISDVVKWVLQD